MANYKFEVGAKVLMGKRVYEITSTQKNKTYQLTDLKTAINSYFRESELHSKLNNGQLTFLDDDEIDLTSITETSPLVDFQAHPKHLKENALRKLAYVNEAKHFYDVRLTQKQKLDLINRVAEEIQDSKPPKSWTTITRWIKSYINSDENINSLVDEHFKKGNRTPRFGIEVEALIQKAIDHYLTRERPTIKKSYKRLATLAWESEITHYPCYDSFRKRIEALDQFLVYERRFNRRTAERIFRYYGAGSRPTRPLEITEIDHTPIPFCVVDDETRLPLGRPTLTTLIDKYSKMVLGFYLSFSPPSILSVIECLRHAILPKEELKIIYPNIQLDWLAYGIPEVILVDNGKEFLSNDFNEICGSLGIQKPRSPPRHPWYKGLVERHFRTIADGLLNDIPGKTFNNIFEKHEYDPQKDAIISFSALVEIVHQWIVDIYNNSKNSSTNVPPNTLWSSEIEWYPPRMPKSLDMLRITLGKTEERSLQHYGVDFESLRYNSRELSLLRRKLKDGNKVKIKYDPSDIGQIFVFDPFKEVYIVAPCLDLQYASNKTLFQHQMIKKYAAQNFDSTDIDALMHAEKRIQEIIENERQVTKSIRRASKKARYRNVGQQTQRQLTSVHDSQNTYAGLSDFGKNTARQILEESISHQSSALPGISDDDLDELYEDSADWQADYSLKKD
ncbi:Mu transposase C-terminal domain-containing protein [uncultured Methylophaga sp.]|jgi:putative transposase|uniref:Mu transposase C-terminal domain-containing protein n=1 Tax=uncultured Methylophaga sp. TaxID=285271 RepID=UPI00263647C3|nr:Mu transposase C-terminal domain-containing protein [uncultured Methylophaga sp.]